MKTITYKNDAGLKFTVPIDALIEKIERKDDTMSTKKYPAPKHPEQIKPPTHKDMLDMIAMASHYSMCDREEMRMGIGLLADALYKFGIHQYFRGGWFGGLEDVHRTSYQSDSSYNKFQWLRLIQRLSTFRIERDWPEKSVSESSEEQD